MTKHVFPNHMVAHVWAQRTQDSGRNGNGNLSFEDDRLYSYAELIGRFVKTNDGRDVALLSAGKWSITTSAHQSAARQAVPQDMPCFTVPNMGGNYEAMQPDHVKNLAALVKEYHAGLDRAWRARDLYDTEGTYVKEKALSARNYAELFGLADPGLDPEADWTDLLRRRAEREARLNTPEARAKREADKEKREARRAERERRVREEALKEASAAIRDWRAGLRHSLPYHANTDAEGGALLRIRGDMLETSLGASVPLTHAVKAFKVMAECRRTGTTWQRNGREIRVGHFQIDSINSDGSFRAGCHVVHWPEVESAARVAGVLQDA